MKKRGNAAMEDERSRQLFQSAEDGVGRAELKRLQKERTRKMQTSNVTLSFGAEPDYTTAASMPDYTRHTRAEVRGGGEGGGEGRDGTKQAYITLC